MKNFKILNLGNLKKINKERRIFLLEKNIYKKKHRFMKISIQKENFLEMFAKFLKKCLQNFQ